MKRKINTWTVKWIMKSYISLKEDNKYIISFPYYSMEIWKDKELIVDTKWTSLIDVDRLPFHVTMELKNKFKAGDKIIFDGKILN